MVWYFIPVWFCQNGRQRKLVQRHTSVLTLQATCDSVNTVLGADQVTLGNAKDYQRFVLYCLVSFSMELLGTRHHSWEMISEQCHRQHFQFQVCRQEDARGVDGVFDVDFGTRMENILVRISQKIILYWSLFCTIPFTYWANSKYRQGLMSSMNHYESFWNFLEKVN